MVKDAIADVGESLSNGIKTGLTGDGTIGEETITAPAETETINSSNTDKLDSWAYRKPDKA